MAGIDRALEDDRPVMEVASVLTEYALPNHRGLVSPFLYGTEGGLTEKEWNSAGTRILILERIRQLETEISELEVYRSQYHEKDKESAVLRQTLRQAEAADRLFDLCLAGGGVLVGLATFLFGQGHRVLGLVVSLIGLVLLVGPLWLKHHQGAD